MKTYKIVSALGIVALSLTACGSSKSGGGSPTEGTITIQGYSGIFQDNYTAAVIKPFEVKYPKIKVKYQAVKSSADNLAALRASKNNPKTDVSIMDVSVSDTGNKSALFAKLDPKLVPNAADIDPRGKNADGYGPAVTFDSLVLIYNDAVNPAPTTWDDLWNPKYKGKVIVTAAPDIQGTSLMLIENAKAGGTLDDVSKGVARLKTLAPSVQTFAPQPDQYTLVQAGQADIAIAWNARAQTYAAKSNGKLKVAIPDDKTIFQINTINLVKDAPDSAAAQTFINYALSPDAQAKFTNTMFYAPTNTKAKPSTDALARTSADPAKLKNVLNVDWAKAATHRDDWTQLWRRDIISGS
ncbi:ABC transporter substrate-binding protein [Flexivirga alba]|uniref:ABC transporter substrate-binding protein n=1 Tax=Flexivirga alba TaxID=702742 RepID=A0ABW2AIN7_9MICO